MLFPRVCTKLSMLSTDFWNSPRISHFGFEGWIWVLTASVPGFCILFTFKVTGLLVMEKITGHLIRLASHLVENREDRLSNYAVLIVTKTKIFKYSF